MKLAAMFRDVLQSLFRRPVTRTYPATKTEPPPGLRSMLHWNPEACTGCRLCIKDCPADAIELITIDKANKRFVMRYDVSRCIFCAQCVQNCRFDCLTFSPDEWELARPEKEEFILYYGDSEDVRALLADHPEEQDTTTDDEKAITARSGGRHRQQDVGR